VIDCSRLTTYKHLKWGNDAESGEPRERNRNGAERDKEVIQKREKFCKDQG